MKALIDGIAKLYAGLMKLCPSRYRHEFEQERLELFGLALQEATSRGGRALFGPLLRELRDLPASAIRANLRALEVMMNSVETKLEDEPFSWIGFLLGLWPFLFAGPLMAVLPYLPGQVAQQLLFSAPLWWGVAILSLLVGLVAGWRQNFPRWVYPYLVVLFFLIAGPLLGFLDPTALSALHPWLSSILLLLAILALGAGALLLLSRISATCKIVNDVRNDWTRLSFGWILFLAFFTGLYTGDHLPPFGPVVWLPSVLVVLGAVVYLLARSQLLRILALLITLGISLFIGLFIFQGDTTWAIWPAFLMSALILSPALLGLRPRAALPPAGQH